MLVVNDNEEGVWAFGLLVREKRVWALCLLVREKRGLGILAVNEQEEEGRKEMFYLMMHSTQVTVIWHRT